MARQPGTLWRYGHSTDVLGRVIEIISGQPLFQFLKQRIFDPLGMTDTKFVLQTRLNGRGWRSRCPTIPSCFSRRGNGGRTVEWESGGGGLLSTITDYARFAQMLLNGGTLDGRQYLSPTTFRQMTSDQIGPGSGMGRDYFYFPGDGFGYGYGLAVRTDPGNAKPPPPGSIGRIEMGQRQRHLFRGRSKTGHALHSHGADPARTHRASCPTFKKLVYDAFEK